MIPFITLQVDIAMAAFLKSVAAGKDQTDVDFIHEKWKFLKSVVSILQKKVVLFETLLYIRVPTETGNPRK